MGGKSVVKRRKIKKKTIDYKGMEINQNLDKYDFVNEYAKWKKACLGISGSKMRVKNIPTLFDFLKNHLTGTYVRDDSRNRAAGAIGQGAVEAIKTMDRVLQKNYLSDDDLEDITDLAKVLEELYETGKDVGKEGIALDPAFIVFTENRKDARGKPMKAKTVTGHYATAKYAKKYNTTQAPNAWFSGTMDGGNIPHQALYNKSNSSEFSSRGLRYILEDAIQAVKEPIEVGGAPIGEDDFKEWEKLNAFETFFTKATRNTSFWKDGRLLVDKLRREFENTEFKIGNKEKSLIERLTKLNTKDSPAGTIGMVTCTATPQVIVRFVKEALLRRGTTKAPDGKPAWQNVIRRKEDGFDFRDEGIQDRVVSVSQKRQAVELAKIPEIKRYAQALLRNTSLYNDNDFQTSQSLRMLRERDFNFSPSSKNKIMEMFNLSDVRKINFKLTKNAMKALLNQSVITRTRDLQSMNAPNTKERIVLKSWMDILRY